MIIDVIWPHFMCDRTCLRCRWVLACRFGISVIVIVRSPTLMKTYVS